MAQGVPAELARVIGLVEPLYSGCNIVEAADRTGLGVREAAEIYLQVGGRLGLDWLRARGFRIAVDDLGAGYAGLTSFAHLSPDFVKFDMSLIRGIADSDTKQKLIRTMNALCHELSTETVGEGVETAVERDHVSRLGCDLLQGYLHGRPEKPFAPGAWNPSRPLAP